jgi:hypothetical protein
MKPEEWASYVQATPVMDLRHRFKQAAHSHKNMLGRMKTHGALVAAEFKEFRSFLIHMGPPPAKGATVDRINPSDPEYAPGKVRWADKATQANNKTSTILIQDEVTGETYTIARLAKIRGISPEALRKQRARGASDHELIYGKSAAPVHGLKAASADDPETAKLRELFISLYDRFDLTKEDVARIERNLRGWFPEACASYFSLESTPLKHAHSLRERFAQLFDIYQPERQHIEVIHRHFAADKAPATQPLSDEELKEWQLLADEAFGRQEEAEWLRSIGVEPPDSLTQPINVPSQQEWAASRRRPPTRRQRAEADDLPAYFRACVEAAREAPAETDSEYDDDSRDIDD